MKEIVPQENRGLSPWFQMASPFEGVHRLLEDMTRGFPLRSVSPWSDLTPRVNVAETEKEVKVTAELPGVEEKDIEVNLTGDVLTLKGEKRAETEEKGKNFHRVERRYGSFARAVEMPAEVDPGKVTAVFKKGVLTVTLAKTVAGQGRSRKIEVRGE